DRKLPKRLQPCATRYASWVERLRTTGRSETTGGRVRSLLKRAIGDAVLVAAVVIGVALGRAELVDWLGETLGLTPAFATGLLIAAAIRAAAPVFPRPPPPARRR